MRRHRADDGRSTRAVAVIAQRLAVLLGAGVAPATAWRHVGGVDPPPWVLEVAAAAEADPGRIATAVGTVGRGAQPGLGRSAGRRGGRVRRSRRPAGSPSPIAGLAAIWRVAGEAGAPLAPALRGAAASLRDVEATERAARVALAGPRATARLVVAMPAVAVVFGALLGYDTIGVLLGSPIGWGCLVVGAALMLAANRWSAALVARAAVADPLPGLELDLLAVALSGGTSVTRARSIVAAAMGEVGLPSDPAPADAVIGVAAAVGAPMVELLRAEADDSRRVAASSAAERAAALETSLMVPLGVCVLPAFVVLGVVPLLVAVMSSTWSML